MGKTKNARFKRAQNSLDGLPVKGVKRAAEDEVDDDDVVESPHLDLLEKVIAYIDIYFFPYPNSDKSSLLSSNWLARARVCATIGS